MTTIIMREKSHELKEILYHALDVVEELCEDGEERRGSFGMRGGMGYRYPEPNMREREIYGERMMRDSRGRYM